MFGRAPHTSRLRRASDGLRSTERASVRAKFATKPDRAGAVTQSLLAGLGRPHDKFNSFYSAFVELEPFGMSRLTADSFEYRGFATPANPVPEPGSLSLIAIAAAAAGAKRRHRLLVGRRHQRKGSR
jgi:PEP-CTERM motif-containing protein